MIFILFNNREHFEQVKSESPQLAVLLGSGADVEPATEDNPNPGDLRVVCNHTIIPAQREQLDINTLAEFLQSHGAEIRIGGIDGELYVIQE